MGQQMSDHRMKRYRPKAFLVVALTAALVLAFAPLAWPQAAEDDDVPVVTVVASDGSASEAGLTTGTFTVARKAATSVAVTVDYAVGGSATAGSDYVALSGSVAIPAGRSSVVVTVSPVDDGRDESNESVTLTLRSRTMYSIGSPSVATVTIIDNDGVAVSAAAMPFGKDACKKGGWRSFGVFKNQGDCVSWVATGGKNAPSGG